MTPTPDFHHACIWYKDADTYRRFREAITDPEQLDGPYGDWCKLAQNQIDRLATLGMFVVKVHADVDEFLEWCKINSCAPDALARQSFAVAKASRGVGQG